MGLKKGSRPRPTPSGLNHELNSYVGRDESWAATWRCGAGRANLAHFTPLPKSKEKEGLRKLFGQEIGLV